MKVSVLLPVYNAASVLPSALQSIASQSYPDIELCVVDDFSTDGSREVLSEFKNAFEAVPERTMVICEHTANSGVAAARNALLDICSGDFICFVDADDTIVPDALEKAVATMIGDESVDIVGWDWTLASERGSRYMRQPDCHTPEDALKALMGGTLRWNLWLYLFRRELYDGVRFLPGANMGEDMTAVIRTMLKAGKFSQIHESLYEYRQTGSSISKTMTEDNLADVKENVRIVEKALECSQFSYLDGTYLDLLKLNLKLPLLVSRDKNDYIRWLECFPESNSAVMENGHLPMRTKVLQWMAAKRLWLGVRLYNMLVYGMFYRILLCGK